MDENRMNPVLDEKAVRDLLELVAADEAPPSRVSIAAARRGGRRRIRLRRVYLPSLAPVAAAAAVALVVSLSAGLRGDLRVAHRGSRSAGGPAASRIAAGTAPSSFNPLLPYARFGWLPAGYSTAGLDYKATMTSARDVLYASAGIFHLISLRVWPAGLCQVTGPMTGKAPRPSPGGTASGSSGSQGQDGETTYPNGLTCNDNLARTPLTGPAADVNGAPAYGTPAHGLVWEYARGAWAILNFPQMLTPTTTHQAMLYQIASSVRYGYPAAVGYGFTISGLPANWQPGQAGASYNVAWLDGRLVNVGWSAGPAQDPGALNLFINPANTPGGMSSCKFIAGQSSYVTIDGVQATLRTIDEPSEYWQSLCLSDIDGLAFYATLDLANPDTNAPLPGGAQVGSLVTVFSHLRLLGPDPTGWTTSPPA